MKFLALISYLLARITLTLISSFAITGCFQKVNFQGFNFVILKFALLSAFLYVLCELFEKCRNNSVLVKIRDSLLCVTNRCIKLPAGYFCSQFLDSNFFLLKGRVKLICFQCKSIKVSHKTIYHLLTVLKLITIILIEQYCVTSFRFLYLHRKKY